MKKKSACAVLVFLLITSFCFAQEKVEKYCEVIVRADFFKVSINLGSLKTYFKDSSEMKHLLAVKNMESAVGVLDYMSKIGWNLVSSTYINYNAKTAFYFKKAFNKSEIIIDSE